MTACVVAGLSCASPAAAQDASRPNILVIMGDDIGYWNISAYNRGMMGYRTPNIDRIANEGAIFTDYYGQQSCTAGRAAFITGQSPMRTGLLKVGLPGAKEGLSDKDPTLAELLKPLGYATGQFGKNHLGDRNEFLPTVHGFDEFFGNLYHLNAEEEPENPDYPKNPEFKLRFGPRGVLQMHRDHRRDPGEDPRFGKWGKQRCEDTGPLTKKRMETVDEEFLKATLDFIDRANKDKSRSSSGSTRPACTSGPTSSRSPRARPASASTRTAWSSTTARSASCSRSSTTWASPTTPSSSTRPTTAPRPSPGRTAAPRRSAARRTPTGRAAIASRRCCAGPAWSSRAPRSTTSSRPRTGCTTLVAAAGEPDIQDKLLKGYDAGDKTFKVHLDGYDQRDLLAGKGPDQRHEFFYWTDDGDLAGLRYDQWKAVFMEQQAHGLEVWRSRWSRCACPCCSTCAPTRSSAPTTRPATTCSWFIDHVFVMVPAQAIVAQYLTSFKDFPPRQKPGSFSVDQAMEKLTNPKGGN